MPVSKDKIDYIECVNCLTIYAPEMLQWSDEQFKKRVYNESYQLADPDFKEARPYNFVEICKRIVEHNEGVKHLDYGFGSGKMVELLKTVGLDSTGYDRFYSQTKPSGLFNFITCVEVLEHVTNPKEIVKDIISFLDMDNHGLLVLTTFTK